MSGSSFTKRLETMGYVTLPRLHADSPGFSGLLMLLRRQPEGHEPQRIDLRLHQWDGRATRTHLHGDTASLSSNAVCPGRIVVSDGHGQDSVFYSFGGALESEAQNGETIYSLRSDAPVLALQTERETVADMLADETEALFARAQAATKLLPGDFLDRLVRAGAAAVYLAILESLLPEGGEPLVPEQHRPEFAAMLVREQAWYRATGRWPLLPRDLPALLETMSAK